VQLAYAADDIYDTCNAFIARGVTIARPPRDARMAFIRAPDGMVGELSAACPGVPPIAPPSRCGLQPSRYMIAYYAEMATWA